MMQHELTQLLLHKAAQDELVVIRLMADPSVDDEIIGFHAQQAVEKLLKAWLSYLKTDYPKVHSLELLLDLLAAKGHVLPEELDVAKLTPFATVFRYEDLPLNTQFDRAEALGCVQALRALVQKAVLA
jgi:HEPN domain-containing protein